MKTKNKKIETKNYIILALIVLVTIFLVFYARNLYIMSKVYYNDNPIILDVVKEVNQEELPNYLIENPKLVLYVSSGKDQNIKKFEKTLKNLIIKERLENSVLYMNKDQIDINDLKKELKNNASKAVQKQIDKVGGATMYIIENGKVINVINNAQTLSKNQIKDLYKKYGVIENA